MTKRQAAYMNTTARQAFFLPILLVAVTGGYLHYALGYSHPDLSGHAWGSDDAYISYRYGYNLFNGYGLVFNPGERVEGYTNFLYTVITALFAGTGPSNIFKASFILNMLCYAATITLFYLYIKERADEFRALSGALLLALNPIMWAWPSSGLETSAVLLIHFALFVSADRTVRKPSGRRFGLFCCLIPLSMLLRADGFIFPLLCCALIFMRKRFRYSLSAVLLILIIFGLCEAARYSYYGELMPNTYYAKISGNIVSRFAAAKDQLLLLFRKDAFYLYLLLLFIGWRPSFEALSRRDAGFTELIPSAPFIVLGLLAYWGYVGGDIYYERFLLILIPLSYVHLMIEARQFQSSKRTAVLLLLLIIMLQFKPFRHDERFDYRLKKYDRWIELGEFLGEKYPKALLAVDAAGKVPFFSKLRTIDMLGLNDKHIARVSMKEAGFTRHKYDADYVLLREPDLIAAWGTDNLDLSWGITREKYRQKGYALKYVLNSAPESRPQNIIDVSGMGEDEIKVLFNKKYKFFVLGRKPD